MTWRAIKSARIDTTALKKSTPDIMVAKKAFTLISTPFRTEIEKEISLVHTVTSKPFGFTIPSDFSRASIQYLIHWPIEIMQ